MQNFYSLSARSACGDAWTLHGAVVRVHPVKPESFREGFAPTPAVFEGMRDEESTHRRRLIELYQKKFGDHIPLIRRQDVKGFVQRRPVWLVRPLGLDKLRQQASAIEIETRRFYETAAARSSDASIRQLLDDLAQE